MIITDVDLRPARERPLISTINCPRRIFDDSIDRVLVLGAAIRIRSATRDAEQLGFAVGFGSPGRRSKRRAARRPPLRPKNAKHRHGKFLMTAFE